MPIDPSTMLQRLRYWQGQALHSRDLNSQAGFDDLLRAWHNRALHQAYGVRGGLEVTLDLAGPGVVEAAPGLAYDASGAELLVPLPERLPLPDGEVPPTGLYLVLRARPAEPAGGSAKEACLPGQAPTAESVTLSWEPAGRFDPRRGVALARLLPGPQLDPAFRPLLARPLSRPRIGRGATLPGSTPWRLWVREAEVTQVDEGEPGPEEGSAPEPHILLVGEATTSRSLAVERTTQLLGLQVEVDTSAAGFTAPPCYLAWLEGDMWDPGLVGQFTGQVTSRRDPFEKAAVRLAEGLALLQLLELRVGHIDRPTASGFTYRLWFPQVSKWISERTLFEYLRVLSQRGGLAVAWLGIQENEAGSAGPGTILL